MLSLVHKYTNSVSISLLIIFYHSQSVHATLVWDKKILKNYKLYTQIYSILFQSMDNDIDYQNDVPLTCLFGCTSM